MMHSTQQREHWQPYGLPQRLQHEQHRQHQISSDICSTSPSACAKWVHDTYADEQDGEARPPCAEISQPSLATDTVVYNTRGSNDKAPSLNEPGSEGFSKARALMQHDTRQFSDTMVTTWQRPSPYTRLHSTPAYAVLEQLRAAIELGSHLLAEAQATQYSPPPAGYNISSLSDRSSIYLQQPQHSLLQAAYMHSGEGSQQAGLWAMDSNDTRAQHTPANHLTLGRADGSSAGSASDPLPDTYGMHHVTYTVSWGSSSLSKASDTRGSGNNPLYRSQHTPAAAQQLDGISTSTPSGGPAPALDAVNGRPDNADMALQPPLHDSSSSSNAGGGVSALELLQALGRLSAGQPPQALPVLLAAATAAAAADSTPPGNKRPVNSHQWASQPGAHSSAESGPLLERAASAAQQLQSQQSVEVAGPSEAGSPLLFFHPPAMSGEVPLAPVFEGPQYSPAKALPTYSRTSPGPGEAGGGILARNLAGAFDAALMHSPQGDPDSPVDHTHRPPVSVMHAPMKASASNTRADPSASPASPLLPRNLQLDMQAAVHTPGTQHSDSVSLHLHTQQAQQAAEAAGGGEEFLWTGRSDEAQECDWVPGAPVKDEAQAAAHHQALRSLASEEWDTTVKALHPAFASVQSNGTNAAPVEGDGTAAGLPGSTRGAGDEEVAQLAAAAALLAQQDPGVRQRLERLMAGRAAQGGQPRQGLRPVLGSLRHKPQYPGTQQPWQQQEQGGAAGPPLPRNGSLPGYAIMLPPQPAAPPPLHAQRQAAHTSQRPALMYEDGLDWSSIRNLQDTFDQVAAPVRHADLLAGEAGTAHLEGLRALEHAQAPHYYRHNLAISSPVAAHSDAHTPVDSVGSSGMEAPGAPHHRRLQQEPRQQHQQAVLHRQADNPALNAHRLSRQHSSSHASQGSSPSPQPTMTQQSPAGSTSIGTDVSTGAAGGGSPPLMQRPSLLLTDMYTGGKEHTDGQSDDLPHPHFLDFTSIEGDSLHITGSSLVQQTNTPGGPAPAANGHRAEQGAEGLHGRGGAVAPVHMHPRQLHHMQHENRPFGWELVSPGGEAATSMGLPQRGLQSGPQLPRPHAAPQLRPRQEDSSIAASVKRLESSFEHAHDTPPHQQLATHSFQQTPAGLAMVSAGSAGSSPPLVAGEAQYPHDDLLHPHNIMSTTSSSLVMYSNPAFSATRGSHTSTLTATQGSSHAFTSSRDATGHVPTAGDYTSSSTSRDPPKLLLRAGSVDPSAVMWAPESHGVPPAAPLKQRHHQHSHHYQQPLHQYFHLAPEEQTSPHAARSLVDEMEEATVAIQRRLYEQDIPGAHSAGARRDIPTKTPAEGSLLKHSVGHTISTGSRDTWAYHHQHTQPLPGAAGTSSHAATPTPHSSPYPSQPALTPLRTREGPVDSPTPLRPPTTAAAGQGLRPHTSVGSSHVVGGSSPSASTQGSHSPGHPAHLLARVDHMRDSLGKLSGLLSHISHHSSQLSASLGTALSPASPTRVPRSTPSRSAYSPTPTPYPSAATAGATAARAAVTASSGVIQSGAMPRGSGIEHCPDAAWPAQLHDTPSPHTQPHTPTSPDSVQERKHSHSYYLTHQQYASDPRCTSSVREEEGDDGSLFEIALAQDAVTPSPAGQELGSCAGEDSRVQVPSRGTGSEHQHQQLPQQLRGLEPSGSAPNDSPASPNPLVLRYLYGPDTDHCHPPDSEAEQEEVEEEGGEAREHTLGNQGASAMYKDGIATAPGSSPTGTGPHTASTTTTPQQQLLSHLRATQFSGGHAAHSSSHPPAYGSPIGSLGSGGMSGGGAGGRAGSDVGSSPSRAASRFKALSVQTSGLGRPAALGGITHLGSYEVPAQHLAPASSSAAASPVPLQVGSHHNHSATAAGSPVETVVVVSTEGEGHADDDSSSSGSGYSSSSSSDNGSDDRSAVVDHGLCDSLHHSSNGAGHAADVVSHSTGADALKATHSTSAALVPPRPPTGSAPSLPAAARTTGAGHTSRGRRSSSRHSLASAAAAGAAATSGASDVGRGRRSSEGDCGASSSYDSEYTHTDSFASDPALIAMRVAPAPPPALSPLRTPSNGQEGATGQQLVITSPDGPRAADMGDKSRMSPLSPARQSGPPLAADAAQVPSAQASPRDSSAAAAAASALISAQAPAAVSSDDAFDAALHQRLVAHQRAQQQQAKPGSGLGSRPSLTPQPGAGGAGQLGSPREKPSASAHSTPPSSASRSTRSPSHAAKSSSASPMSPSSPDKQLKQGRISKAVGGAVVGSTSQDGNGTSDQEAVGERVAAHSNGGHPPSSSNPAGDRPAGAGTRGVSTQGGGPTPVVLSTLAASLELNATALSGITAQMLVQGGGGGEMPAAPPNTGTATPAAATTPPNTRTLPSPALSSATSLTRFPEDGLALSALSRTTSSPSPTSQQAQGVSSSAVAAALQLPVDSEHGSGDLQAHARNQQQQLGVERQQSGEHPPSAPPNTRAPPSPSSVLSPVSFQTTAPGTPLSSIAATSVGAASPDWQPCSPPLRGREDITHPHSSSSHFSATLAALASADSNHQGGSCGDDPHPRHPQQGPAGGSSSAQAGGPPRLKPLLTTRSPTMTATGGANSPSSPLASGSTPASPSWGQSPLANQVAAAGGGMAKLTVYRVGSGEVTGSGSGVTPPPSRASVTGMDFASHFSHSGHHNPSFQQLLSSNSGSLRAPPPSRASVCGQLDDEQQQHMGAGTQGEKQDGDVSGSPGVLLHSSRVAGNHSRHHHYHYSSRATVSTAAAVVALQSGRTAMQQRLSAVQEARQGEESDTGAQGGAHELGQADLNRLTGDYLASAAAAATRASQSSASSRSGSSRKGVGRGTAKGSRQSGRSLGSQAEQEDNGHACQQATSISQSLADSQDMLTHLGVREASLTGAPLRDTNGSSDTEDMEHEGRSEADSSDDHNDDDGDPASGSSTPTSALSPRRPPAGARPPSSIRSDSSASMDALILSLGAPLGSWGEAAVPDLSSPRARAPGTGESSGEGRQMWATQASAGLLEGVSPEASAGGGGGVENRSSGEESPGSPVRPVASLLAHAHSEPLWAGATPQPPPSTPLSGAAANAISSSQHHQQQQLTSLLLGVALAQHQQLVEKGVARGGWAPPYERARSCSWDAGDSTTTQGGPAAPAGVEGTQGSPHMGMPPSMAHSSTLPLPSLRHHGHDTLTFASTPYSSPVGSLPGSARGSMVQRGDSGQQRISRLHSASSYTSSPPPAVPEAEVRAAEGGVRQSSSSLSGGSQDVHTSVPSIWAPAAAALSPRASLQGTSSSTWGSVVPHQGSGRIRTWSGNSRDGEGASPFSAREGEGDDSPLTPIPVAPPVLSSPRPSLHIHLGGSPRSSASGSVGLGVGPGSAGGSPRTPDASGGNRLLSPAGSGRSRAGSGAGGAQFMVTPGSRVARGLAPLTIHTSVSGGGWGAGGWGSSPRGRVPHQYAGHSPGSFQGSPQAPSSTKPGPNFSLNKLLGGTVADMLWGDDEEY